MTTKKHSVKVVIANEEFSLRSDASPEHAQAVANQVDEAIRRVVAGSPTMDPRKAAILAALQISDELIRARQRAEALAASMRSLADDVRRYLPPTKRATPAHGV